MSTPSDDPRPDDRGPHLPWNWALDAPRWTRKALSPQGPPTAPIPVWTAPDGIDRDTGKQVIDLAMMVGVGLLATGAPAVEATIAMLQITNAYGLRSVHADVTYNSVAVSYHRGPLADPMTMMRVVGIGRQDFTRLGRLLAAVDDVATRRPAVDEARERVAGILRAPHPYRRWIITLATALLAAAAAVMIGASAVVAVVAFLAAGTVHRVQLGLSRRGISTFFQQAAGGAIATGVALLVTLPQDGQGDWTWLRSLSPTPIVASTIVVLFAGLSVVGSARDAIEGYYITAGAKAFEVIFLTVGIVAGISTVLALGALAGHPVTIRSGQPTISSAIAVGCAAVLAAAFAVASYAMPRAIVVSGAGGAVGYLVYLWLGQAGAGAVSASALAAGVAGFFAQLFARRVKVPAIAATTASILPLVPGRAVYQGLTEMVHGRDDGSLTGLSTLVGAAGVGLGLAAGVTFGIYLARVFTERGIPDPRAAHSRD